MTGFGKGGEPQTVLLPADVWRDLASLRGSDSFDNLFSGPLALDRSAVFRIVRRAIRWAEN